MKLANRIAITGTLGLLACSCVLLAVTPKFWDLLTQEDLVKGRLRGVSLGSDGKLSLAPQYDSLFETGQALVVSMAADGASNVYLGTGHEGRVYRVDSKGSGSLFFTAQEIDVFALACDAGGNLYVGSSPDGKVYKVGPGGKGTEFFDPEDKYIWDMTFDREGNLYVATGGKGLLYRVDKTGTGKILFDSDEVHLMTLCLDAEGNILAGSAPNGQVYRISREGRGFVILDSPLSEIRRVTIDRLGNVYAVALSAASGGASLQKETDSSLSTTPRSRTLAGLMDGVTTTDVSVSSEDRTLASSSISAALAAASAQDRSAAKSIIYRIAKDGTFEKIWTSNTDMVFDLVIRDDGKILAGTGTKSRILAIDPLQSTTILSESGDESVTRLLPQGNDLLAAASNMGKLYRLQPLRARSGEYESDVFDAGLLSFWGQLRWKSSLAAGTTVEIYTRSGNTAAQNQSWSDWSGPYTNKEGEAVKSPQARYIQWKAVFKSSGGDRKMIAGDDTLEGLSIAYLQQNVRPLVSSISLLPPGTALQKQPSLPSGTVVSVGSLSDSSSGYSQSSALSRFKTPPRRVEKAGAQAISWKASDDNEDLLHYTLYFKGDNETEWKLLEKELEDDFYTIDSNDLPDGTYTVKVVASDELSNAFGKALRGELVSKPFVINNSAPSIALEKNESKARRVEITYRAKDAAAGLISSSEFSIDGGPWHLVFPKDGIADSREEEYFVQTPELSVGEHVIGIRVTNIVGGVGAAKLVVKVP
jgi:hypothetical protein